MTKILGVFLGLFIDDELLAIGILGVVGASAMLSHVIGIEPLVAGAVLICGNVLVLIGGVVWTVLHRVP